MDIRMLTAIFMAAVLGGMRITYGWWEWSKKESAFHLVWKEKRFYYFTLLWLAGEAALWFVCGLQTSEMGENGSQLIELSALRAVVIRLADLTATYLILAFVDIRKKEVPDRILVCYFCSQLLLGAASTEVYLLFRTMISGFVLTVLLLFVAWISKDRVGFGDAKLLGVTAMTAGCGYTIQVLSFALVPVFFYGIWQLLIRHKTKTEEVPFVPFLFAGMMLSIMQMLR